MRKVLHLVLGLTSAAMLSHASLTPVLQLIGPQNGDGSYTYFYDVTLDTLQQIDENNRPTLTFYDFYGYVPNTLSVLTPDWTGTDTSMSTPPPSGTLPPGTMDNPGVVDFTFTYTGPLPTTQNAIEGEGQVILTFAANSIFNQVRLTPFSSLASKDNDNGIDEGTGYGSQGEAEAPAAIPEPATMSLVGGVLLGIASLRGRFAKRQA